MIGQIVELSHKDFDDCADILHRHAGKNAGSPFYSIANTLRYLEWHARNPCRAPDIPLGIGVRHGGRIKGMLTVCPVPFDVSGVSSCFLLAQDYMVDEDCRPGGLGIWRRFRSLSSVFPLYSTTSNDLSTVIWERSGAHRIPMAGELQLDWRGRTPTEIPTSFNFSIAEIAGPDAIPPELLVADSTAVSLSSNIDFLKWKASFPSSTGQYLRFWRIVGDSTNCVIASQLEYRMSPTDGIVDVMHIWGSFSKKDSLAILAALASQHGASVRTVAASWMMADLFDGPTSRSIRKWATPPWADNQLFIGPEGILNRLMLTPLGSE